MSLPDLSRLATFGSTPLTTDTVAGVVSASQLNGRWSLSQIAAVIGGMMSSTVINVKDYGALGNGSHDDTSAIQAAFDAAYGSSSSPHGTNYTLNKAVYFPPGNYIVSGNPALTLTNVQGAYIYGAGRFTTTISHQTSGGVLLETDGFEYSVIEKIYFSGSGGAGSRALNLSHHTSGYVSVQSNSLEDLYINNFEVGINLAAFADGGGSYGQGSEILVKNCYIASCSGAGIATNNANALAVTVIGGNIASCGIGAHMLSGSMFFFSVGFQANSTCDIKTENSQGNTLVVSACRSESVNFISSERVTFVLGCSHLSPSGNGYFLTMNSGYLEIASCLSSFGDVELQQSVQASIRNSQFGRSDWLTLTGLWWTANNNTQFTDVYVENVANGVIGQIVRQRIALNDAGTTIVRSYDVEATALTDQTVIYASGRVPVSISIASPGVIRYPPSPADEQQVGLIANDQVVFTNTGGALPTGITAGTAYFVKTVLSAGTFTVSATAGGAAINTSGSQSGTQFLARPRVYAIGDVIWKSNPVAAGSPGWVCTTAGTLATGGAAVFKAMANIAA